MSNFIPIEAEGDRFYIEVLPAEGQTGIKQRSRDSLAEKLTRDDFKQMVRQAVMPACQTFVDVWQELNQPLTAEGAEVEFNLGFTATGSAVIVQASGQASFKVKVSWKFQQKIASSPPDGNALREMPLAAFSTTATTSSTEVDEEVKKQVKRLKDLADDAMIIYEQLEDANLNKEQKILEELQQKLKHFLD